ncbi:MAG: response regulator transcription factor [Pseudomonadota bacterium]
MTSILIVEDNADLAFGLRSNLELEGYTVRVATSGPDGLAMALENRDDLLVLDVMLPDIDGFELLARLRRKKVMTPVLMLTARGEEMDKVRALRSGADDYVTKPFGLMELMARIEALLRRAGQPGEGSAEPSGHIHRIRDFAIDSAARTVHAGERAIELAPKEFDLLLELVRHAGVTVSRSRLMRAVWGHSGAVVSRTVDTHVAEIRRKLGDPSVIVTVRKAGYRIAPE